MSIANLDDEGERSDRIKTLWNDMWAEVMKIRRGHAARTDRGKRGCIVRGPAP